MPQKLRNGLVINRMYRDEALVLVELPDGRWQTGSEPGEPYLADTTKLERLGVMSLALQEEIAASTRGIRKRGSPTLHYRRSDRRPDCTAAACNDVENSWQVCQRGKIGRQ